MRNLYEYADKCEKMVSDANIKFANSIRYYVNYRAKRRWGLCKRTCDGFEISISSTLLDEANPESGLIETLIHEILHTCRNCFSHKGDWLYNACLVNRKYGLNVKRCSSFEDKGIVNNENPIIANYIVTCQSCGHEYVKERFSKLVKHPEMFRCKCGGNLARTK